VVFCDSAIELKSGEDKREHPFRDTERDQFLLVLTYPRRQYNRVPAVDLSRPAGLTNRFPQCNLSAHDSRL
jgi:hypothetical protein